MKVLCEKYVKSKEQLKNIPIIYKSLLSPADIQMVYENGLQLVKQNLNYSDPNIGSYNEALNAVTVGASGGVFGILLAFGMMFPNHEIYLYFLFQ